MTPLNLLAMLFPNAAQDSTGLLSHTPVRLYKTRNTSNSSPETIPCQHSWVQSVHPGDSVAREGADQAGKTCKDAARDHPPMSLGLHPLIDPSWRSICHLCISNIQKNVVSPSILWFASDSNKIPCCLIHLHH